MDATRKFRVALQGLISLAARDKKDVAMQGLMPGQLVIDPEAPVQTNLIPFPWRRRRRR